MKKVVLSELDLPGLDSQTYEFRKLIYHNRLLNYILQGRKGKQLMQYLNNNDVDMVVCCRESATFLAKGGKLGNIKLIQLTSTGFDGVPVKELESMGCKVANVSNVYSIPIAETVVYALLNISRRFVSNPKSHIPKLVRNYNCMSELSGRKCLVLGVGNIGVAIAKRLSGLEVIVDGYARTTKEKEFFRRVYNSKINLMKVLYQYDFVISTLPGTEETHFFCDNEFFDSMNNCAVFMNVGRMETVDSDALYQHLKSKKIGGAIIDSVRLIPYAWASRFGRLRNTLMFPGIASESREGIERVQKRIISNIEEFSISDTCRDILK